MRVVSLLPSATELLCHAGGRDLLVGRSHECDFPPTLAGVPVLTAPAIGPDSSPAGIDRQVRDSLAAGEPLYRLDAALLADLRPDLILTQDLCHVCSIDLAAVRAIASRLPRPPEVLSLNPRTLEDVLDDLIRIGRAIGRQRTAADALAALRERIFRAADHVNPYADGPSVCILEWTDPLFVAGHWTPQLVERAGARHPLNPTTAPPEAGAAAGPQQAARRAGPSRAITIEELAAGAPEWIVVAPCGVGLEGARRMVESVSRETLWRQLPAARARRVAIVDGNQMFSRPGPRLVDAFEWLVGWVHGRPELMPRGFPWDQPVRW